MKLINGMPSLVNKIFLAFCGFNIFLSDVRMSPASENKCSTFLASLTMALFTMSSLFSYSFQKISDIIGPVMSSNSDHLISADQMTSVYHIRGRGCVNLSYSNYWLSPGLVLGSCLVDREVADPVCLCTSNTGAGK